MPSPKTYRKGGQEKNKKGKLSEKASSFHGRGDKVISEMLPRPRTVPDLLVGRRSTSEESLARFPNKLTKLLLNVTIQRSPGPVQVVISPEATVKDLITAALRQYAKEARRPVLTSIDASGHELHYSQFSLESLDMDEKLITLGSRNFFICPKNTAGTSAGTAECGDAATIGSTSSCSKEANKTIKKSVSWLRFMDFLL